MRNSIYSDKYLIRSCLRGRQRERERTSGDRENIALRNEEVLLYVSIMRYNSDEKASIVIRIAGFSSSIVSSDCVL